MADGVDAEHEVKSKSATEKRPVTDWKAAMAAVKRAQERGDWPQRKGTSPQPETTTESPDYDPAQKQYPTREEREKLLASMPAEETIPAKVKKGLTEQAQNLNTMAMEGADVTGEKPTAFGLPTPEQAKSRQEGVDRFKGILKAQEGTETIKTGTAQPKTPKVETAPPPSEAKAAAPASEEPTQPSARSSAQPPVEPMAVADEEEDTRPMWLRKQAPVVEMGRSRTAVGQVGAKPTPSLAEQRAQRAVEQMIETKTQPPPPPLPTTEQVGAQQSVQQGQKIRKRWFDRIPFLNILRGERKPAG